MICDKCGKSNASGVAVCSYCGMEMPKSTECNGFADILTVKAAEPAAVLVSEERGKASDVDMKNLLKKTNEIFKNTKFSLAAICICILISVISILMTFNTNEKLNEYEKKLDTIIENTSVTNEDKVIFNDNGNESTKGENTPDVLDKEEAEPESEDKFQEMKKAVETKVKKKQQSLEKEKPSKTPAQPPAQSEQTPAQSEQAPTESEQAPAESEQVTAEEKDQDEETQG